jgi:serine phosphatase RsbU (regulator of sigma subunit)/ABC-type antimicrobial peptide transport system permease subunit
LKRAAAIIAKADPIGHPSFTAYVDDLRDALGKEARPAILVLFSAAALLFLLTCANVSGVLLSRSLARVHDTAVRVALGASRAQLAKQFFVEGLAVSLTGAVGGLGLSAAMVRWLSALIPDSGSIPILSWDTPLFAAGAALLASLISMLAPLWQALRMQPNAVLNEGVRSSQAAGARGLARGLVVSEIALAFALLTGAVVLTLHMRSLAGTSPGFDSNGVLTFSLSRAGEAEDSLAQRRRFADALRQIPGVTAAAYVSALPLDGCCMEIAIFPEGKPMDRPDPIRPVFRVASAGFWEAMRIPLLAGRTLQDRDERGDVLHILVNQAAAQHFWPQRPEPGVQGRFLSPQGSKFQVAGIIGNAKNRGLGLPSEPEIYLPAGAFAANPVSYVVRSALTADRLMPQIREAIRKVDTSQPIYNVREMRMVVEGSLSLERVVSLLVSFFALAALLLVSLGVFGVVSYDVRQRTVEMGTRMAVGATARDLLRLVLSDGWRFAALGMLIGGVAVAIALPAVQSALRVEPMHALAYMIPVLGIGTITTTASFFPAWRATLLSPMVAIRNAPESMWESAAARLRSAFMQEVETPVTPADIAGAARNASTFREASDLAIEALRERTSASAAMIRSVPDDGFLAHRLRFYPYPLPLPDDALDAALRWAREHRPSYVPEIEDLRASGARLAVPLQARNELTAVLLANPPDGRDGFDRAEREVFRLAAPQLALMRENDALTQRLLEQEKLRNDLAMAAEVQRRLLPGTPPPVPFADLAGYSLPARVIGGDYYDFLPVRDRLGIAIADIAGKGIAAALLMSVVQSTLRMLIADEDLPLPVLAARMNRFVHQATRSRGYATFFYAVIDPESLQLHYVNAGHNPPYVVRANGEIEELTAGGAVIGLFPALQYESGSTQLRKGDLVFAFTDGVSEAMSPSEEEFGEERIKDLLRESSDLTADALSLRVQSALRDWMQDAPQHDDLTFCALKITGTNVKS